MTTAYWSVLMAAYLPIIWTAAAKFTGGDFKDAENRSPRDFLETLTGWRKRAHWAQLNGFEAFPPFAAAVIIAHQQHAPQTTIDLLAVAFVALRVLHGVFYIGDLGYPRSITWFGAVGCVIALFAIST